MGIFSSNAQDQVDLDDLKARVAKLEAAVMSLQSQAAGGAVPYGTPQATLPPLDGSVPPADVPWMSEVQVLASQGQKIQAIKLYRERTGVGLAQAKDAVDRMG